MEHLSPHRILKRPRTAQAGFTLVEMLIVLLIIGIITMIVFSGQTTFNRTLSLNNTTYDVALSIRQAQSYGLSSRAFSGINSAGYGVYFQSATPSSYIFFADVYPAVAANSAPDTRPGNGLYDTGVSPAELVQTYTLNNGFTISQFCAYSSATGQVCTSSGSLTALSVTYSRPDTQTTIMGKTASWAAYTDGCAKLSSSAGDVRYVSVSQTGQVQAGAKTISVACP